MENWSQLCLHSMFVLPGLPPVLVPLAISTPILGPRLLQLDGGTVGVGNGGNGGMAIHAPEKLNATWSRCHRSLVNLFTQESTGPANVVYPPIPSWGGRLLVEQAVPCISRQLGILYHMGMGTLRRSLACQAHPLVKIGDCEQPSRGTSPWLDSPELRQPANSQNGCHELEGSRLARL